MIRRFAITIGAAASMVRRGARGYLIAALAAVAMIGLTPAVVSASTIMRTQKSATTRYGELEAVTCLSAKECTAVGGDPSGALAEHWNGTKWAMEPAPPGPGTNHLLSDVSCTSATACTAVGSYVPKSRREVALTLAEHWNGKAWTHEPTPNPTGTTVADLVGVSCSSAAACIAVGQVDTPSRPGLMLAEGWNGKKWVIESTPEPRGVVVSGLSSVSCSSATSCVAVGNYSSTSSGGSFALVEGWNGKKWAYALPPNPKGTCTGVPKPGCTVDSEFLGVSCTSVKACTAVGQYVPFSVASFPPPRSLVEDWNGKKWTIESSPSPKGTTKYIQPPPLDAVSCSSAKACTAVGQYVNNNDIYETLAEGWNGKRWVIEPTPAISAGSGLYGISCKSSQCTAVGIHNRTRVETLAEGWNGKKWVIEPPAGTSGSRMDATT
jgi:hypothetical protein